MADLYSMNNAETLFTSGKFQPGVILATRNAVHHMALHAVNPVALILRHINGDFGELEMEDVETNMRAIASGSRVFSSYNLGGQSLYVITEAVNELRIRHTTTILLWNEY